MLTHESYRNSVFFSQKSTKYYYYFVFAITIPSSLWAYRGLLFFLLSLLLWLSLTFASLRASSQDCPVSNSWLLQAPPLEGAAELTPVSLCSVPELPSLLLAGVDKGPRRQKGKDFLSPILLTRVLGSSAVWVCILCSFAPWWNDWNK